MKPEKANNNTNFQPLNRSLTNMGIYYVDFSVNQLRQPANHHHGCLLLVIDLEKRCFSAFASSQRPFSISLWSGRNRLSVGAVPPSQALRPPKKPTLQKMFESGTVTNWE
ncbi:hypothetical protein A6R68_03069, partial [Neotoma lepida]